MSDKACPFCGSKNVMVQTPFIDPITKEAKKSFCCNASKKNQTYIDAKYHSIYTENKPSLDEVSKP